MPETKISPFIEEVAHLTADFLDSVQLTKEAQKIRKQFELPEWVSSQNPVLKKGLKKIIRDYINADKKIVKYYQNRKPDTESESDSGSQEEESQNSPPVKKKVKKNIESPKRSPILKTKSSKNDPIKPSKPKENSWVQSQFAEPQRLEDVNDLGADEQQEAKVGPIKSSSKKVKLNKKHKTESSSEESSVEIQKPQKKQKKIKKQKAKEQPSEDESSVEVKPKKKQKAKKKVKGPVDTSYLNSDDEFELQKTEVESKKKKKHSDNQTSEVITKTSTTAVVTRKKSADIEAMIEQKSSWNAKKTDNSFHNGQNGYKKSFSRINIEEVGPIRDELRDNSFNAKARFGAAAGDSWGQFGHEKLKDTRGDSFKKTKGKLKNKAFQGSGINIHQINSVKL